MEKAKKREEEEYQYNLTIARTKEVDAYNFKKAKLEQEITDVTADINKREDDISTKDRYLLELEEKVENFPATMAQEIGAAERNINQQLEIAYKHDIALREQTYESTKTLHEQKVKHLEARIIEQEDLIKDLNCKATSAIEQVQSIAYKALDTSYGRVMGCPNDTKAQEKPS